MNGKDIFLGLQYIGGDLVENAEHGQFSTTAAKQEARSTRALRRPLLIAATIGAMLLLAGCAVVYALSLHGIKLGDQEVSYDLYDDSMDYTGQVSYTQQVLTLAGLDGTPASQAAREWYAFLASYDPDSTIKRAVFGSEPEFPEEYAGYNLYTQEMKDKLDEILTKYHLKLRGKRMEFQTAGQLLRALGLENVMNPISQSAMRIDYACYYENGNLDLDFVITLPDGENPSGVLHYRPKDCLIPDTAVLADVSWEEWNYTTQSGQNVLIIRSEEASSAWIFCDLPSHTASMRVDTILRMDMEAKSDTPTAKFQLLSRQQLEQIADAVDFSLEPKLVEGWESLPDNAVPAGQEINGYTIEPVSTFTDGYCYEIFLRITAPEGVVLVDMENGLTVKSGNHVYGACQEDGDGKDNTCFFRIQKSADSFSLPEDGSLPFPEGYIVPLYWEDLYSRQYDFQQDKDSTTLLTQGTWRFDIPLTTADTREIELVAEPVTVQGCTGWDLYGNDVVEDVTLTSVKLRAFSIDCSLSTQNTDIFCFNGQFTKIVMLDGSFVEFPFRVLDAPVDLDQVAYVQLADGTVLPMPGVDEEIIALLSARVDAQTQPAGDEIPLYPNGQELISEPVTIKNLAGYATDATGDIDLLYEYFQLTSFVLHPEGAVALDSRALEDPDTEIRVFLKNGEQIRLTNSGCGRTPDGIAFSTFTAETAIDLTQADHVLLPDGTEIPIP